MNNPLSSFFSSARIMNDFLSASQQLRQHDQFSLSQLRTYQAAQLDTLRDHAYKHSAFYQRFHKGLMYRPLNELPVLTKAMMMDNFDDLVTDPAIRLADIETH